MELTINHILYIIVFLAVFVYLLKINRAIYYFIMSCLLMIFFLVSGDLTMSIAVSGVVTALIFIFIDKEPLKKRKSMLLMEHMENKKKAKKTEKDEEEEETNGDETEEFTLDAKNSYLNLMNSLKPDELSALTSNTQELIKTQKTLMETLQNMGPALQEGKNILSTFKDYFGDENSMKDLLKI